MAAVRRHAAGKTDRLPRQFVGLTGLHWADLVVAFLANDVRCMIGRRLFHRLRCNIIAGYSARIRELTGLGGAVRLSAIDKVLARNADFARDFVPVKAGPSPALKLAVVTCMDVRLNVEEALGLQRGDAHVIRNAGAAITQDTIRSLIVSQFRFNTREIMLIKHTQCGMHRLDEEALKDQVERITGVRPDFAMERAASAESALRESARRIRECPLLRFKDQVRGFVYDVDTGVLTEVSLIAPPQPRNVKGHHITHEARTKAPGTAGAAKPARDITDRGDLSGC